MKEKTKHIFDELFISYPDLLVNKDDILKAFEVLKNTFSSGHKLLICGNGGSASDVEHMSGELLKNFRKKRTIPSSLKEKILDKDLLNNLEKGYPVISLVSFTSFISAYNNDHDPKYLYAQEVSVLAKEGDTLLIISTSGNSKNCLYACKVAKALGVKVILLSGMDGGEIKPHSDISIIVNKNETYQIQERHLPIYHALCAMIEEELD